MDVQIVPSDRFLISPNAMFQHLHGEIVILDMESDSYFGLNSTGACIWESLSSGSTIEEASLSLATRFSVLIEQARYDTIALTEALMHQGLVTRVVR
jgi:hypothetical protein